MAERAYGAPLMSLGQESHTVWATREDVEAWAGPFVAALEAQGWDRSAMPSPSICVLTSTSAIASGEFVPVSRRRERAQSSRQRLRVRQGHGRLAGGGDARPRSGQPLRCD